LRSDNLLLNEQGETARPQCVHTTLLGIAHNIAGLAMLEPA